MTLSTNLEHIATREEHSQVLKDHENIMVCCGRMGPMCLPVYGVMEQLQESYPNVAFRDMLFDSPEADVIRNLPEARGFMGLPFVIYYKNGKVVEAKSSIQSKDQITEVLDRVF